MALILAAAPMRAMRAPVSSVSMSATEYAKTLPGAGPFGFFDPLKLLEIDKDMTEGALCPGTRARRACVRASARARNCVRVSIHAPAHYAPTLRQHTMRTEASARALTRTAVVSLSQALSAIGARSS
jgi:hypothetical protein